MQFFEKVKTKAVGVYDELVLHWNRPAKGNFVSYKELVNYAVGGVGKNLVLYLMTYMALSASNTLIGSTIGIRPLHLQYMSILQTILGIFFAMIRGKWVDNTRTRMGKFRPFIAFMGIPLVVLALIYLAVILCGDTIISWAGTRYAERMFEDYMNIKDNCGCLKVERQGAIDTVAAT